MAENNIWESKLSVLDRRIAAFRRGYRQNIAVLGYDSEEISYLLNNYLSQPRHQPLVYIHVTCAHHSCETFFQSLSLSLLASHLE